MPLPGVAAAWRDELRIVPPIGDAPCLKLFRVCSSAVPPVGIWRREAGPNAFWPSRWRRLPETRGKHRSSDAEASGVVSFFAGHPLAAEITVGSHANGI